MSASSPAMQCIRAAPGTAVVRLHPSRGRLMIGARELVFRGPTGRSHSVVRGVAAQRARCGCHHIPAGLSFPIVGAMKARRSLAALAGLAGLVTACDGPCYMIRNADATGRFGDTLVAVSRGEATAGTARLNIHEESGIDLAESRQYAEIGAQALASSDTIVLIRLTRFSDNLRSPVLQWTPAGPGPSASTVQTVSPGVFETLFTQMAAENLLFEVQLRDGTTAKALLKLEKRNDRYKYCEPYT